MGMAADDSSIGISEQLFAGQAKLIAGVTKHGPRPKSKMCVNVHGGLILPQSAMNAGLGLEQSAVINPQGKEGSIGP